MGVLRGLVKVTSENNCMYQVVLKSGNVDSASPTSFLNSLLARNLLVSNDRPNQQNYCHFCPLLTAAGRISGLVFAYPTPNNRVIIEISRKFFPFFKSLVQKYDINNSYIVEPAKKFDVYNLSGYSDEQINKLAKKSNLDIFTDSRLPQKWHRILSETENLKKIIKSEISIEDYSTYRISNGIIDLFHDEELFASQMPLALNLDKIKAVSLEKGCYLGQEALRRATYADNIPKRTLVAEFKKELNESKRKNLLSRIGKIIEIRGNLALVLTSTKNIGFNDNYLVIKAPSIL
ncbi:MAG: ccr4 associated factor, partial [Paramarteilia canceri]